MNTMKGDGRHSDQPRLVDRVQLAGVLGISPRHVARLHASRLLPAPIRLGRSVRWSLGEIAQWLQAGAPDQATWRVSQAGHRPVCPDGPSKKAPERTAHRIPRAAEYANTVGSAPVGDVVQPKTEPREVPHEDDVVAQARTYMNRILDGRKSGATRSG